MYLMYLMYSSISYHMYDKCIITLMLNKFNTRLAAQGELAHCLQRRTVCKIQNGHWLVGTAQAGEDVQECEGHDKVYS